MRGSAIAGSLVTSLMMLSAGSVFGQATGQTKPAQPATAPKPAAGASTQTPAPTPPLQTPPAAPAPTPAAQPPAPFPQGAKIAIINPQRVFQESVDGKAALGRVQALIAKKQNEGQEKTKTLQANQQKLQTSGSVMNEAARSQLEKEVEKEQLEGQRFQQDAQAEINELQTEVQQEFIKKVTPILQQMASEKGLQMVFNAVDAGLAYVDPGLDLTTDLIKKLDALSKPGAAPPKD
jgi:outer membrane protein